MCGEADCSQQQLIHCRRCLPAACAVPVAPAAPAARRAPTHPIGDPPLLQLPHKAQGGPDLPLGDPLVLFCSMAGRGAGQQAGGRVVAALHFSAGRRPGCLGHRVRPGRALCSAIERRAHIAAPAASHRGAARTRDGALDAEQRVVQVRQHLVPVRVLQALACTEGGPAGATRYQQWAVRRRGRHQAGFHRAPLHTLFPSCLAAALAAWTRLHLWCLCRL